jgi:hypothetical protein
VERIAAAHVWPRYFFFWRLCIITYYGVLRFSRLSTKKAGICL